MSKIDIARALKDKTYFDSLSPESQAEVLAQNPSGEIDLQDDDLVVASGGDVAAASGSGSGSGSGGGDAFLSAACDCSCNCNC